MSDKTSPRTVRTRIFKKPTEAKDVERFVHSYTKNSFGGIGDEIKGKVNSARRRVDRTTRKRWGTAVPDIWILFHRQIEECAFSRHIVRGNPPELFPIFGYRFYLADDS